jgi:hypothetical protein
MAAAKTVEKKTSAREAKAKVKAELRKQLEEIRKLALRQGYVTEDQIVWQLGDDDDPEKQVEQMEDVHAMLNQMRIEVFASEEEAHERIKKLRKIEDKKEYGFKARLVWKKFVSPEDCQKEYETWAAAMGGLSLRIGFPFGVFPEVFHFL